MSEINLKEVIDRTDCDLERKPNEGLFVEISEDYFHWLINKVKSQEKEIEELKAIAGVFKEMNK